MTRLSIAPPIAAFLDLVALSEGTSKAPNTHDDGYDIIVCGIDGRHNFSDYSAHPFAAGRKPIIVRTAPTLLESTASGRYQIILPTWKNLAAARGLGTFSPQNQDMACLALLEQSSTVALISAGKIEQAIEAECETWASFPGNNFGQGGRTLDWLLQQYAALLNPLP
jgi:muramidase (phage lysozyme)